VDIVVIGATPRVTVLMSVYNGGEYLDEAVSSIRDQSFEDFEFIIINDGSTDNSVACLDRHAQEDARIRILYQDNRGLVGSLNRGLAEARAGLVARMDSDDFALSHRLEAQVRRMDSDPSLVLLGGHIQVVKDIGGDSRTIRFPVGEHAVLHSLYYGSPVAHPTVMMRTDLVRSIGGYRPFYAHCEDYDLWLRMSEIGKIDNLDDIMLKYRQHGNNVSTKYRDVQAKGTFLAQAAWMARRSGQADPTDTWTSIENQALEDVQLPPEEQWALLCRYVLSVLTLDMSYSEARKLIARLAQKPSRFTHNQASDWARLNSKLALIASREKRQGTAIAHAAVSFRYAPLATIGDAIRKLRERL
jgi:hypothetical protein